MRVPCIRSLRLALFVAAAFVFIGCPTADDDDSAVPEPEPDPLVEITGNHAVEVASTLSLSASTVDGTDGSYTWTSSDEAVATVDALSGLVTGVAAGEADITATGDDTDAWADHPVVVTEEPVEPPDFDIVVTVSGAFYLGVNATAQLSAMTVNGTDSGYTWEVDAEAVALIDEDGMLTGVDDGLVTVTATGVDTGESGSLGVVVAREIPNFEAWSGSGHSDRTAEAFVHWDEDGEISTSCARCHSTPGYLDYLGADGTDAFVVDNVAPLGTVVECVACHNDAAAELDTVIFPSGVEVTDLGPEARCMTCHQGRASADSVDVAITDAALANDDTISADLGFINIHYFAAGATLNAGLVRGGYQYAGEHYDVRFRHVSDRATCVECHDPHSLEIRFEECQTCHEGMTSTDDLHDIRMEASLLTDYDGDGDMAEGVHHEMTGVAEVLYEVLLAYAAEMGAPLCYSAAAYPYFFNDSDSSGVCEDSEANYGNKYASWTARSLRGAYNYQVSLKDPGAFAHNAKYIIQVLYDSAMDLNAGLGAPQDLSSLTRNDPGHFNGAGEAARHWDEDEEVSASCAKCHGGAEGFRFFLEHGVGAEVLEQGNGLDCETCHDTFADVADPADAYATVSVTEYEMPSGETFDEGDASNICANCHSGRKYGGNVDASSSFQNIHYLPAAAFLNGTDGQGGYEYATKTYAGKLTGHLGGDSCLDCHDPVGTNHTFQPNDDLAGCGPCHSGILDVEEIRGADHTADYDGDGDASEPLVEELDDLRAALLEEMQSLADICYASGSYPYWFNDTDGSGMCDGSEASYANSFSPWTEPLKRAAYNYQAVYKDPGAWAHNFDYAAQLLYDGIEDTGGAVGALTRP